jgi:hypothetical protein
MVFVWREKFAFTIAEVTDPLPLQVRGPFPAAPRAPQKYGYGAAHRFIILRENRAMRFPHCRNVG